MGAVSVKIKGIAPLFQHRFPEEDFGVNATKARKAVYDPQQECEKALYQNDVDGIYQPSDHLLGALIVAGASFKYKGLKTYKDIIKQSVNVTPDCIPHENPKWEIDSRSVVIERKRIMRSRPLFHDWSLSFEIEILDDTLISPSVLKEILEKAGKVGIGDYRPRYGRFMVTEYKVLNN
jgi:hypothetical protein